MASDDELEARIAGYLQDPAMWEPASTSGEDDLVAAIAAQRQTSEAPHVAPGRERRRSTRPFLAGVAAALLVVAGVAAALQLRGDSGIELTLAGTELDPDASAQVTIETTDIGTRLVLDVSDLDPPEDGYYYEAWLRTGPDVGVSAGTFHMRGGDGEIELWAGVLIEDYPLVTVTLQEEAAEASSGVVVLKGLVE